MFGGNLMAIRTIGKPKLTSAGLVLGAISALVMFFSAVPVVMLSLPDHFGSNVISFIIVFLIGPAFFFVGAGILRLFGVRVFKPPDDAR
jgi:hypothetical protein